MPKDSLKNLEPTLAGVAQWLECHPVTEGSQVQFLVRAHTWITGLLPSPGGYGRRPISASLSHWCLSLDHPFSLHSSKSNEKKSPQGKITKINKWIKFGAHQWSLLLRGKFYFKSLCLWYPIDEMGGWQVIAKSRLDASSMLTSKGLSDLSASCWISHRIAMCNSYLSVPSLPMKNRFPVSLALKRKKNHHHHRKVAVRFLPPQVECSSDRQPLSEQHTHTQGWKVKTVSSGGTSRGLSVKGIHRLLWNTATEWAPCPKKGPRESVMKARNSVLHLIQKMDSLFSSRSRWVSEFSVEFVCLHWKLGPGNELCQVN